MNKPSWFRVPVLFDMKLNVTQPILYTQQILKVNGANIDS